MSKEIEAARRENGLTIRYLAQGLVNDLVFPDQKGIHCLLQRAKRVNEDGSVVRLPFHLHHPFEYSFLFHLDDFGSGDKSEIDLLLRQGDTLYAIEVKAFTNPNDTNVKREIVRNHLKLEELSNKSQHFSKTTKIVSILLYSESKNQHCNSSAKDRHYFNEKYLQTKGVGQKEDMVTWDSKSFEMKAFVKMSKSEWDVKIKGISDSLFFLTWRDVLDTFVECNEGGRFESVISELGSKRDEFKGNVPLI